MKKLVIFKVNADMISIAEKDQIAGTQIGFGNGPSCPKLLIGTAWQIDTKQIAESHLYKS